MRDALCRSTALDALVRTGECHKTKDYQALFNLSEKDLFYLLINTDEQSVFHRSYFWSNRREQFPATVTEHLSYPLVHRLFCHPDKEGYSALRTLLDIYTTEDEIHELFRWLNQEDTSTKNTALKLLCLQNKQNHDAAISTTLLGQNPELWFTASLAFFTSSDFLTLVTAPSSKNGYDNFFTLCLFDSKPKLIGIAKRIIETTSNFLDLFANIPHLEISNQLFKACKKNPDIAQLVIERLQHTPRLLSKQQRQLICQHYTAGQLVSCLTLSPVIWGNFLNPLPPSLASSTSKIEQPNDEPASENLQQQPLPLDVIRRNQPELLPSPTEKPLTEKPPPASLPSPPKNIYPQKSSMSVAQKTKRLSPFRDCTLPLSLASTFLAAGITFSLLGIGAAATVFALTIGA
jgi:hypothetical protein